RDSSPAPAWHEHRRERPEHRPANGRRGPDPHARRCVHLEGPVGTPPTGCVPLTRGTPTPARSAARSRLRAAGWWTRGYFASCGLRVLTPAQTVARVAADHAKWGRVVKEANIRAD